MAPGRLKSLSMAATMAALSDGVGLRAFTISCVNGGFWFVGSSYWAGAAVLGSKVVTCFSSVFCGRESISFTFYVQANSCPEVHSHHALLCLGLGFR